MAFVSSAQVHAFACFVLVWWSSLVQRLPGRPAATLTSKTCVLITPSVQTRLLLPASIDCIPHKKPMRLQSILNLTSGGTGSIPLGVRIRYVSEKFGADTEGAIGTLSSRTITSTSIRLWPGELSSCLALARTKTTRRVGLMSATKVGVPYTSAGFRAAMTGDTHGSLTETCLTPVVPQALLKVLYA